MAYEKHTWSCGEDITDALLNHMEEGIEEANQGGGNPNEFVINASRDSNRNLIIDKTFDEVATAYSSGKELKLKFGGINHRFYEREASIGGIEFRFVSDIVPGFFIESATSTAAYVNCFVVSNNADEPLKTYAKGITLTFSN